MLHWGLVEMRRTIWGSNDSWKLMNPLHIRYRLRRANAMAEMANALHNLAAFSAWEFDGFDEAWFWRDVDRFEQRYPEVPTNLRQFFEIELTRVTRKQ